MWILKSLVLDERLELGEVDGWAVSGVRAETGR